MTPPTVYLDADACPVKDIIYRASARYRLPLKVVANTRIRIDASPDLIAESIVVPGAPDAADDWIAEHATSADLVLTADIPLAARVIRNGARCLDFRGGEFTPNRIGDALASRDLAAYMRSMGLETGGPKAYSKNDRAKFASMLDAALNKLARTSGAAG